jgi:hypothetical protein
MDDRDQIYVMHHNSQTLTMLTACMGEDWKPLRDIVEPNLREYAARWGHDFQILDGPYYDHSWSYPMQKTAFVRDVVQESKSEFFWVLDIDLLITNMILDVRDWLDDEHAIFMAKDISGQLNCGSYLIRNCAMAKVWLDSIIRLREETTSEQHAIIELGKAETFSEATRILPHPSINSLALDLYPLYGRSSVKEGQWENGHLVVHLPGMTPQRRAEILGQYANWVIR